FAGKTGSAQTISNTAKARLANGRAKFKDNGWFAGVAPRRNPDSVECALVVDGEHGYSAPRVVAQVIKAYVEKHRQIRTMLAGTAPVERGGAWSVRDAEGDHKLQAG